MGPEPKRSAQLLIISIILSSPARQMFEFVLVFSPLLSSLILSSPLLSSPPLSPLNYPLPSPPKINFANNLKSAHPACRGMGV